MNKKVSVIGSGFSGLAASACLAQKGYEVNVFEKNALPGGRARKLEAEGFVFDMGPTWYWLPDVFENFFGQFGKTTADFYQLKRLDPSYRMFFSTSEYVDLPADYNSLLALFNDIEAGSADKLDRFLKEAEYKYRVGMDNIVHKPGLSLTEYFQWPIMKGVLKLDVFRSISTVVKKLFHDERLHRILEFPVIFLGAKPSETPALYSLMNYADMKLGTWYPAGGMYSVVEGMVKLAESLNVKFHYNTEVSGMHIDKNRVKSLLINGNQTFPGGHVVASADYAHVDSVLTPPAYRNYKPNYWEKRTMAPSALLFYLGINRKLPNLLHHNLVFDTSFDRHAEQIYTSPEWPDQPAIYISCSTKTDATVAPEGHENVIVLIPVAPGLNDTDEIKTKYFNYIISKLNALTGIDVLPHIVYKKMYAHSDFINDYHAFKGNAYGLANTLRQTGIMKPKIKSKKLKNLFYAGQLTTPGPGVPPSIISGMVAADILDKNQSLN